MSKEIYIEKKAKDLKATDYQKLQETALETVQQLSGNVWTDYNEHDPGVTIMDAFNYALTELHYKLSFPFEEYLTDAGGEFKPNDYGLFLPGQVYPTAPVTPTDYRKLFFDSIQDISDVWLRPSPDKLTGTLDIIVDLSPSTSRNKQAKVEAKIMELYHESRNLGECLGKILFREKQELEVWGEIHLNNDADAAEVIARIYFQCAVYFNSGIKYHNLRQLLEEENDWSILLDGPMMKNGIIDERSILSAKKTYYVSELHYLIKGISGVKAVESITMEDGRQTYSDEIDCFDILHSYNVSLPSRKQDVQLILLKNNKEVYFSFTEVQKQFKKLVIEEYGKQNQFAGLNEMLKYPRGKFIDFSGYHSIQNDFPNFYGINDKGIPAYFPDERKAQAKQLKAYLLLFDFITAGSMQEINHFRDLLKVDAHIPQEVLPDLSNTVAHFSDLVDEDKKSRSPDTSKPFKTETKNQLFDLLDALYGEKSYLRFMSDFNLYGTGTSTKIHLQNRANFIQNEHKFIEVRAQGVNLLNNNPENIPGIKQWFAAALGLTNALELPVTNIFSEYSLRLLSDDEFYNDIKGLLNIDFVVNKLDNNFDKENIFDVPAMDVENPRDKYLEFCHKIYLLHHNIIFESFLRNGIFISNYKILQPAGDDFILAYHAGEKEEWVALGRFEKHFEAIEVANQLRLFLIDLNLQSENVYLIEHLLLNTCSDERAYTLQVINNENEVIFSLLYPAGRQKLEEMKVALEEVLANPSQFEIRETEDHQFLVLLETEDQNAIYCQQRFNSIEEATGFLNEFFAEQYSIQCYTVQNENELFPLTFMDFNITAVIPGWSARFHNKRFRAWCEELLEERRPAHLNLNFLWLEAPEIRQFEKLYFAWRTAIVDDSDTKTKSLALARFINEHLKNK